MFDKLVESKETRGTKSPRQNLLAAASAAVITGMGALLVFSLFNQTLAMGDELLDLTRLVTPTVATVDEDPPEVATDSPEPDRARSKDSVPTRIKAISRVDTPPLDVPDRVSSEPSAYKSVPPGPFRIDKTDSDPYRGTSEPMGRSGNAGIEPTAAGTSVPPITTKKRDTVKPPPTLPKSERTEYIGVVNGKATDLPKPAYSQAARNLGITGAVKVEVLIDENGSVITASAIEGNGLLRRESVNAAKRSKFTPTTVGGRSVKVRGIIIYNFQ